MRTWQLLGLALVLAACGDKEAGDDGGDGTTSGDSGTTGGDGSGSGSGSGSGDDGPGDPDNDGDGYPASEDCDDTNPDIYPFADEYCDGVDNDCDGDTDESTAVDAATWYIDEDGDGYGGDEGATVACDQPADTVPDGGDCDDDNVDYNPGVAEDDCTDPEDYNCDGEVAYADVDGDGFAACEDCDDDDDTIHPDATEVCDGIDNDCDSLVDDDDDDVDLTTRREFWPDADSDSYGDATVDAQLACAAPANHVENADDCDDSDSTIHPAATEVCDDADVDEDCNGVADDADSGVLGSTLSEWFEDADSDGYGAGTSTLACEAPSTSWIATDGDCDDTDSAVNPSATEVCDAADVDEDCDGTADDSDSSVDTATMSSWYPDSDGDGYGDDSTAATLACDDPSTTTAYVSDATDCDDADSAIHPAADEICDSADTDEDCDGLSDDDDPSLLASSATEYFPDADGDGYGDPDASTFACDDPDGSGASWISDDTDCDDADSAINPGATELCDDVDNDCDASTTGSGSVSYDSGSGTLTDVSSSFSGSSSSVASATLSSGTYYFCDDTFYVSMTASSGATVDLVGSGAAVLSGATTDLILDIAGADVTLTDLTLEDGYGSYYGGTIACESAGSITLDTVTIQDGSSGYYGGGIYSDTCDVTATDSAFLTNSAAAHGGAFYVDDGDILLDNVDIDDNYAYYQGAGGTIRDGVLDATDTLWDGNYNAYSSTSSAVAALNVVYSDFYCTKVTQGGFTNNSPASSYGTGAMGFSPYTGNEMYSYGCDWGTSAGGDDNGYYDIYWNNPDYWGSDAYYSVGDNETFTCDDTYGCYYYTP